MAVFGDLNEVKVIGNIVSDLELKNTQAGKSVLSFRVATNRRTKVADNWKDVTEFISVVVWGKDAEFMAQKARKGTRLYVGGRLQTRSWEGKDGGKRYATEVVADKVILLERYQRGPQTKMDISSGRDVSVSGDIIQGNNNVKEIVDPDDLPF
jgi:single-strand DNA-binding protein